MSANGFRWSPSSLSLLTSCGEAFRRRYVEGERTPARARMIRGRVVHNVAQHTYERRLREEALPSKEEAQDLAATQFESAWQEGVELEPDERAAGEAQTKGDALDFSTDLSGYHVERVAPSVHPIAVEEAMTVRLPESNVLVHGIIDLIALDDTIRDIKTSERTPQATAAETSLQLTIYAALFRQEMQHLPKALTLDYLVRTPAKRMKSFIPLTTTRDEEDMQVLSRRINTAVQLVEANVYLPAPADSWKCTARFCDYYHDCVFVRRGARRPVT